MKYPENERILIVRPCLNAICSGVRSASKLLSVILYRCRNVPDEVATFQFSCTQSDLVYDLCGELTSKQLHDMAIPALQLFGYLDVDGSGFRHRYTIHLDKIRASLCCYNDTEKLELLLISSVHQQLEKLPKESSEKLEEVPNTLEEVLKQLELLLKTIRESSNSKRGRKPRVDVPLGVISGNHRLREIGEIERYDSSPPPSEQITEPFLVPTLPLRDDMSVNQSSYSHEPAAPSPDKSDWLSESTGEEDIFSEDDPDETVKRPVVQGGNLAPGEGRAPLESEDRREGSNEHPAIKPTGSRQPPAPPGQAARMREQPTEQYNPADSPRQPTKTPEPEVGTPPLPDKTGEKGNRKKDVPLLCEPSTVRKLIDANRGHVLKEKGAIIHQNIVLREWSEQNPLEHYHEVMKHLKTCRCKNPSHQWWHKDEHWRYLDADNLVKLTPGILSELGLIPKPELPPDIPMPVMAATRSTSYTPVMAARPR